MLSAILCLLTLRVYDVMGQGECVDVRGRSISHGLHYVPGPDTCTLCVCENGQPKVCKAVLCSPPQDCRSFRVGNTCCEFICLDDVVKAEGGEANARVAAGGAVIIVLLTVAVVVYRVRKQKRRRPLTSEDQRSLNSIGYISGSVGYVSGNCETGMSAWKPPNNYMPRGEAPPPYDEAVAQSRADAIRTYPATVEAMVRPEEMQCTAHYVNLPRPMQQVANSQGCFNTPLLQTVHSVEVRDPVNMGHHPLHPNVSVFPSTIRLTGSLGTISNRGLLSLIRDNVPAERPQNVPGFYTNSGALPMHTSLHRTIPRISTAVDTSILDSGLCGFNRDRSLHNEIRRSFHKPNDNRHSGGDTGRSMPRNLNLASNSDLTRINIESNFQRNDSVSGLSRSRAHSEEQNISTIDNRSMKCMQSENLCGPQTSLPLTVDQPSCVCSYSGESVADCVDGDGDDYRNECANCKSATSSRPAMGPSNWDNWFNTIHDSDTETEEE